MNLQWFSSNYGKPFLIFYAQLTVCKKSLLEENIWKEKGWKTKDTSRTFIFEALHS